MKQIFLICTILLTFSCNNVEEEIVEENFDYNFTRNENKRINDLVNTKPDSAIVLINDLIEKNPKAANLYFIRAGAYFELKEFSKCKEDYTRLLDLKPEIFSSSTGMIEYLDCKIETNGDCGDSTLPKGSTYIVDVTDTIIQTQNGETKVDTASWTIH